MSTIRTTARPAFACLALLVCLCGGCSGAGVRAERGGSFADRNILHRLAAETGAAFGRRENLRAFGLAALGSAALMATADRPVWDCLDDHKPLEALEPAGDAAGYFLPVALVVGTRTWAALTGDEELARAGRAVTDAALLTFLSGEALVTAFGRERPRGDKGPHHFEPFGYPGNRSLPMLHPAVVNSQLRVLSEFYPDSPLFKPWVRYPLTGAIAYLRMEKGAHWASDVLPGFVLSEVIGKEIARLYGKGGKKSAWRLVPRRRGIALRTTF